MGAQARNGKAEHALGAWVKPISVFSISDIFVSDSHSDISEPKTSIPSLKKFPISSLKLPPKTSHISLDFDVPSESSFQIHSDISISDSEDYIQDYIQPMTFIDSFSQPLHDQKTKQPSSSQVGNSENCLVSNAMSLVYVVVMSCMYFIGLKYI